MGVQSPVLDVFVNMCSGCSNHGNCDFDNLLSSEENKFRKVACDCDPGYFGMLSALNIYFIQIILFLQHIVNKQNTSTHFITLYHVNHYNTQNVVLCFVGFFFLSKTYMYKDKARLCKK